MASAFDEFERIDEVLSHYRHLASVHVLVDGQPSAAVTLTSLANAIGISPSHLARLFQEKVGMTFHHWLMLRRIRTAMKLMHERPITAFQAAHFCGFASYRSFARAFKAIVGLSPSTYRKQAQQSQADIFAKN